MVGVNLFPRSSSVHLAASCQMGVGARRREQGKDGDGAHSICKIIQQDSNASNCLLTSGENQRTEGSPGEWEFALKSPTLLQPCEWARQLMHTDTHSTMDSPPIGRSDSKISSLTPFLLRPGDKHTVTDRFHTHTHQCRRREAGCSHLSHEQVIVIIAPISVSVSVSFHAAQGALLATKQKAGRTQGLLRSA